MSIPPFIKTTLASGGGDDIPKIIQILVNDLTDCLEVHQTNPIVDIKMYNLCAGNVHVNVDTHSFSGVGTLVFTAIILYKVLAIRYQIIISLKLSNQQMSTNITKLLN